MESRLAAGLIEHSDSPWSCPLVVVPEKNGSFRITVNFKWLNVKRTIGRWPLSSIDGVTDSLGHSSVFFTFNVVSGFFLNVINPYPVKLTALISPRGLYQRLWMPRGYAAAPGSLVRLMQRVTLNFKRIRMKWDDVNVHDASPSSHMTLFEDFCRA